MFSRYKIVFKQSNHTNYDLQTQHNTILREKNFPFWTFDVTFLKVELGGCGLRWCGYGCGIDGKGGTR